MYCEPNNAGLASKTSSVCKRLGKLLTVLDSEISYLVVTGEILEDIRAFRSKLVSKLHAEGWTMSYGGTNIMKVRQPGHKEPFVNK